MHGEAYFEVAKDAARPFIVKTSHYNIEVLGTRFNVADYDNDMSVHTTLVEGKVAVSRSQESVRGYYSRMSSSYWTKIPGSRKSRRLTSAISWLGRMPVSVFGMFGWRILCMPLNVGMM